MKGNRNGETNWGKKGVEKKTEIDEEMGERQRWKEKEGRDKGRRDRGSEGSGEGGAKGSSREPEGTGHDTHLPSRVEMTWTPTTCSAAVSAQAAASRATRCPPTAPAVSAGPWRNSQWKVRAPTPPTAKVTQLWLCSTTGRSLTPFGPPFRQT